MQQFKENRRPTQAELVAAAPGNPVYVQLGYGWAMVTPLAMKALNINSEADLPSGGRFEKDASGKPTGAVTGGQGAIIALFDKLPRPSFDDQVEGTRKFFRELNRLAVTGVVDPGGNNLTPDDYQALFKVWRDGRMTVRVATVCAGRPGVEFEELKAGPRSCRPVSATRCCASTARRTHHRRDEQRSADGVGQDRYYQIVSGRGRGMPITMHWGRDGRWIAADDLRAREPEVPIGNLRWSIAHLNDASVQSLQRMKALGVGWTVQDAMYFGGEQLVQQAGPEAARRVPPVNTATKIGVVVGAGTDAHRVASYNPFTALQWFIDGKTVGGVAIRGPEETPTRADALRFYTMGSAWFSRDDHTRGSLEAGKLADLAVLSSDYLTVPVDQLAHRIGAHDGRRKVVYAGPGKE